MCPLGWGKLKVISAWASFWNRLYHAIFFSVYPITSFFFACGGHNHSFYPFKISVYSFQNFSLPFKDLSLPFQKFQVTLQRFRFTFSEIWVYPFRDFSLHFQKFQFTLQIFSVLSKLSVYFCKISVYPSTVLSLWEVNANLWKDKQNFSKG